MDAFEIVGIAKDNNGMLSHCDVKGYGIQPIAIIDKLIREDVCSFFTFDKEKKRNLYAKTSPNGTIFLTTDPNGSNLEDLNFIHLLDKPLLRQLIELVR